jgi:hypothetical protein
VARRGRVGPFQFEAVPNAAKAPHHGRATHTQRGLSHGGAGSVRSALSFLGCNIGSAPVRTSPDCLVPAQLAGACGTVKTLKGDEKSEAQTFLDRLFKALGHVGAKEAGTTSSLDHGITSAILDSVHPMKRCWQILALVLLVLMVPASVCCLAMPQEVNQECDCCSGPDEEHEAPAQPCPSDTISHSQLPSVVVMPEMQMVELMEMIQAFSLRELTAHAAEPVSVPATAPPELRTTWVFVSRAALPARAPSERV